jgi:hypothetical protein
MCSHTVLLLCTLPNSLLCHARSLRIRPSLRMNLMFMGLQRMCLLQQRHSLVLPSFLSQLLSLPTSVMALSPPNPSSFDMSSLSSHLCLLTDQIDPSSGPLVSPIPAPPRHGVPVLLSTITLNKVLKFLHHSNTSLPAVCPCDTPNNSDTKTHPSGGDSLGSRLLKVLELQAHPTGQSGW